MSRTRMHNQAGGDQDVASWFIKRGGLTFDFDAGAEAYDYRVSIGGGKPDRLAGGADRDYLFGLAGNDRLFGYAEDDLLYGDRGNDLLVAGAGMDLLDGGGGNDRLFGGADNDGLRGGGGNDYLDEGAGHGMLEGGRGDDVLVGGQGPDAFVVDRMSGNDVVKDFTAGPGMFDHLAIGGGLTWEDLSFEDTSAGVRVSWQGGSVLLEGVTKAELAQDDFMFADAPGLPPGARPSSGPAPEADYSLSSDGPAGGAVDDAPGRQFDRYADWRLDHGALSFDFTGEVRYSLFVGTRGPDQRQGDASADQFIGRDGDDSFAGGGGNDLLQGDAGNDSLRGEAGMDKLDGGTGDDSLSGGAEADELMGQAGNDRLDAGAGHDMVDGGMGDDFLIGGTGADAFIVSATSGNDIVFDFEARGAAQGAFDHLALSGIDPGDITITDGATRLWNGVAYSGVLVGWNTDADAELEGSALLVGLAAADLRQSDFMFEEEPGFVSGISSEGSWYVFA